MVASIPCIRSRESAGPMVENGVTDQMVGDRRSPGSTILGVEFEYLLRQPSLLGPPTGLEHRDALWTVYELASPERADRSSLLDMIFVRRCGVPRSQLLRQWQSFVFVVAASMADCCGSSSLRGLEQVDEWISCCSSHDLGFITVPAERSHSKAVNSSQYSLQRSQGIYDKDLDEKVAELHNDKSQEMVSSSPLATM